MHGCQSLYGTSLSFQADVYINSTVTVYYHNKSVLLSFNIGLHVTITVDYIAPPDASGLGPNDYWAASGPMNVTCFAAGSTGTVTYQWSSNCRMCRFGSNPTTQSVIVPVLSSGLTGNATCTAMDATGSTNRSSTELVVVGKLPLFSRTHYQS